MASSKEKRREINRRYEAGHPDRLRPVVMKGREYIWEYKRTHPCVDCGEDDPIVLEFDHRDRSKKLFNIGATRHRSLARLKAEVAKCDMRCANCHRRKTWLDIMFWGTRKAPE